MPNAKRRAPGFGVRNSAFAVSRDDRGVATLEGIFVFALLAGVLLGCMLLGQWGIHLQSSQMGARLLTFNAGSTTLAKFGRASDSARQTLSTGGWDAYAGTLPATWLNTMFVLPNERYTGRVKGTQHGRQPSSAPSLFAFTGASVSYFAHSSAASNSWATSESLARTTFNSIAYYVGRYRVNPQSIGSKPTIPGAIPVVESIYSKAGAR